MSDSYMESRINKTVEEDTLSRALRAQMQLLSLTGEKLIKEHQMRVAETLLSCGITMIPCEHLLDHQFAVSPGVYRAAKELISAQPMLRNDGA